MTASSCSMQVKCLELEPPPPPSFLNLMKCLRWLLKKDVFLKIFYSVILALFIRTKLSSFFSKSQVKFFWICHSFPLHKSISQSACSSSFTPLKAEVRRWWWNLGRLSLKIAASYSKWPGNDDVSSWDAKCAWKEEECDKSLEKIALFCQEAKIAKKRWPPFSFPFCPRKNGRSCLWSFSDSGATCRGGGGYLWLAGEKFSQLRIPVIGGILFFCPVCLLSTLTFAITFEP